MARKKRESKAKRWSRAKAQKRLARDLHSSKDPNRTRIELDEMEFGLTFTLIGGQENIGDAIVIATNRFGQKAGIDFGSCEGVAVGSNILGLDRGKVGRMVAQWKEAEAVLEIRARLKNKREQKRIAMLDNAVLENKTGWYRHGEQNRSVLIGTNNGIDPEHGSDGIITTYKTESGCYELAREFWDGDYSQDGTRKGVVYDRLPVSFRTAKEAQRAFLGAIDGGETLNFESGVSATYSELKSAKRLANMADSLEKWKRRNGDNIVDMKEIYQR